MLLSGAHPSAEKFLRDRSLLRAPHYIQCSGSVPMHRLSTFERTRRSIENQSSFHVRKVVNCFNPLIINEEKEMTRKTIFNLMGIMLLLAVILSACAPAATPTAVPTAAKPSGKVTLWMWKAAHDTLTNSGVLDEFAKEYPDVQVEVVEYAPTDVYQKLPLALQAGTGAPDISLVENSHLAQIVALGGLTDMTEWVTPYVDKMNAYKWADAELDGKYYAMPWDSGPVVFYYRRDVFEKAGLPDDPAKVSELVATWDDYLNVCK